MQSCRAALAARELEFFRKAAEAHAEGDKDASKSHFDTAKMLSAAILAISANA